MQDKITVTIPAQEYSGEVYIDNENCYLATALKKAGFKNVYVGCCGGTTINGYNFYPEIGFGALTLMSAFGKSQSVTVTLIKE